MISPERKEILDLLQKLSELAPDMRFGQLIVNLSYAAIGPSVEAPWDVEDTQLLETIREQVATLSENPMLSSK